MAVAQKRRVMAGRWERLVSLGSWYDSVVISAGLVVGGNYTYCLEEFIRYFCSVCSWVLDSPPDELNPSLPQ